MAELLNLSSKKSTRTDGIPTKDMLYLSERLIYLDIWLSWKRHLLKWVISWFIQKQPLEVFYRKGALKNSAKFTGKHLRQSLFFNKVAGLRPEPCIFIKKETLEQVFSCEFRKISKFRKTLFLTEHLRRLLLCANKIWLQKLLCLIFL